MGRNSSYRAQSPQLLSLFHLFFVSNSDNQCFSNFQAETTDLSWYALSIQYWDEIWSYLQVTSIYSWSTLFVEYFFICWVFIFPIKQFFLQEEWPLLKLKFFCIITWKFYLVWANEPLVQQAHWMDFSWWGTWLVGRRSPSIQKGKSSLFIIKPLKYQIRYTRLF